jgi:hypothetical protein
MFLATRSSCRQSDGGETSMPDGDEKNDLFVHEWTSLKTLWHQYQGAITDARLREELEKYFGREQPEGGWEGLNRAEQIIGMYLDPDQLKLEYNNLLALAKSRKLPSLSMFESYERSFFGVGGSVSQRRGAYLALLYTLQSRFVELRLERKLKAAAAYRLLWVGIVLVAAIATIHWAVSRPHLGDPMMVLAVVFGMGVFGAFFSRVATFQTNFSTLRFETVAGEFHRRVLWVRMLYGGIGAIVFYYILRSGLVHSHFVPDWSVLDVSRPPSEVSSDKLAPTPATEWSKLLVWSFFAGFSEQFVSKSLDKVGSE